MSLDKVPAGTMPVGEKNNFVQKKCIFALDFFNIVEFYFINTSILR